MLTNSIGACWILAEELRYIGKKKIEFEFIDTDSELTLQSLGTLPRFWKLSVIEEYIKLRLV